MTVKPCSEDTGHHFTSSWYNPRSTCTCGEVVMHTQTKDKQPNNALITTFTHAENGEPYHLAHFTIKLP